MSFKEIKELRQAGKLDEALQMALDDMTEAKETLSKAKSENANKFRLSLIESNLIWPKRALAWVYYDYLKKSSQAGSFDAFKENLINIKELQLHEDEKMVFDNCAWQIGRMVFSLQNTEKVDYSKINDLFEIIKNFHFTKPSEAYSFVYKAFHKGYHNWSKYLEFADWWNFENFCSGDYLKEEYYGKKLMSIVEQAYIAYSKKLLEGEPEDIEQIKKKDSQLVKAIIELGGNLEPLQRNVFNKSRIIEFLPRLSLLIERHPEYQYPPYYKAKLLLASGSDENVVTSFLPFARQKRNDFWVWELMADLHSDNNDLMLACYLKALSLKTPDQFLVNLRQKLIPLLINKEMYKEAITEIEKIVAVRVKNNWKIPNEVTQWKNLPWYKPEITGPNNNELYSKYSQQAEELLFQDDPEEIIAIEFINRDKTVINFVRDQSKHGFFNYSGFIKNPKIGEILLVRFNGEGKNGHCQVLTLKRADVEVESPAIRKYAGPLQLIPPQNFGFVDNVYVNAKLVQDRGFHDGQKVRGRAILSFNKKKDEWGWKAFTLEQ